MKPGIHIRRLRLAIIGATGVVGRTTLDVMEEWGLRPADVRLFASGNTTVQHLPWADRTLPVEPLATVPGDVDIAVFATGNDVSRTWVPRFAGNGIVVIDHSSEFRQRADVPLVVPEVNGHTLARHGGLVANPNCVTSILALPLKALHDTAGLETVVVSTFQSVSGAGEGGVRELRAQRGQVPLADAGTSAPNPRSGNVFTRRIDGNVIPLVGELDPDGISGEEAKIGSELAKLLELPDLAVLATAVRVPVQVGHCASVAVKLRGNHDLAALERALRHMPGMYYDAVDFQTPLEIAGRDDVFASRLRPGPGGWWQFWVAGDNLRKGAASNGLQILLALCGQPSRMSAGSPCVPCP